MIACPFYSLSLFKYMNNSLGLRFQARQEQKGVRRRGSNIAGRAWEAAIVRRPFINTRCLLNGIALPNRPLLRFRRHPVTGSEKRSSLQVFSSIFICTCSIGESSCTLSPNCSLQSANSFCIVGLLQALGAKHHLLIKVHGEQLRYGRV